MTKPGFYPDPAGSKLDRYWDGNGWTDHLRNRPGQQSPPLYNAPVSAAPSSVAGTEVPAFPSKGESPGAPGALRGKVLWATAVAVLVLSLGGLAFSFIDGVQGVASGAASPEAAVEQFVASIAGGDPLGLANSLHPAEAQPLSSAFTAVLNRARAAGVDFGSGSLFDEPLAVTHGTPDVTVFGDGVMAAVSLPNVRITLPEEPSGLRPRIFLPDFGFATPSGEEIGWDSFRENGGLPFEVLVVQDDGKWYVSAVHTTIWNFADIGNRRSGPEPSFAASLDVATGAESPDALVSALVAATNSSDLRSAADLLDPVTAAAYHTFRNHFEWTGGTSIDQLSVDLTREGYLATVDAPDFTLVDLSGRRKEIRFDRLSLTATDAYEFISIDITGNCVRGYDGYDELSGCLHDPGGPEWFPLPEWVSLNSQDFRLSLVIVEREGRWYVDPISTVGGWIEDLATAVPDNAVEYLVGVPEPYEWDEPISLSDRQASFYVAEVNEIVALKLTGNGVCVEVAHSNGGQRSCNGTTNVSIAGPGEVAIRLAPQSDRSLDPEGTATVRAVSPVTLEPGKQITLDARPDDPFYLVRAQVSRGSAIFVDDGQFLSISPTDRYLSDEYSYIDSESTDDGELRFLESGDVVFLVRAEQTVTVVHRR